MIRYIYISLNFFDETTINDSSRITKKQIYSATSIVHSTDLIKHFSASDIKNSIITENKHSIKIRMGAYKKNAVG
jgi:hypothetical protein